MDDKARSADLHSAVSQNCILRGVSRSEPAGTCRRRRPAGRPAGDVEVDCRPVADGDGSESVESAVGAAAGTRIASICGTDPVPAGTCRRRRPACRQASDVEVDCRPVADGDGSEFVESAVGAAAGTRIASICGTDPVPAWHRCGFRHVFGFAESGEGPQSASWPTLPPTPTASIRKSGRNSSKAAP